MQTDAAAHYKLKQWNISLLKMTITANAAKYLQCNFTQNTQEAYTQFMTPLAVLTALPICPRARYSTFFPGFGSPIY
jgi:hypothetical protein